MGNRGLSTERSTFVEIIRNYSVIFTALVLVVVGLIMTGGLFISPDNLTNVGDRAAVIGIVAIGQMLVILTGNIDLSVSGIMAVGLGVGSELMKIGGIPFQVVILLMLVATTGCGALNGLMVSRTKIPAFMLTLGTFMIYTSLGLVITKASSMGFRPMQEWINSSLVMDNRLFSIIIWLALGVFFIFVLRSTKFGKNVYATGANELASTMSGVKTRQVKFSVYMITGALCGLSALTMMYRLGQMNVSTTGSYQIESIASVVVGGASLNGGEGNVYGTLIGAFIMAALINLLNIYGIGVYEQNIIKGLVLLGFVILSNWLTSSKKGR